MFLKKDKTDEELKEKRLKLESSQQKAEKLRNDFLTERVLKLKSHSKDVYEKGKQDSQQPESAHKSQTDMIAKFDLCQKFLLNILDSSSVETFQLKMQKSETLSDATEMVRILESPCPKETYEFIKYRPKVFMSLIMLATYPNEVMPEANPKEREILECAKLFLDALKSFFNDKVYSKDKYNKMSCIWVNTIHVFDEWLVEDKAVLFDKMKKEFLIWTETVGNIEDEASRSEWEQHALQYQNEVLKKICTIFGDNQVAEIIEEVNKLNLSFKTKQLLILPESHTCEWGLKDIKREKNEKTTESDSSASRVPITNIKILHELMLKENSNDFDAVLSLSGKSMDGISYSNREGLSKLIVALSNEGSSEQISNTLKELFTFICGSLSELSGENEDYYQEISLIDCSINQNDWIAESCHLLRWVLSMCRKCCSPARDLLCTDLESCVECLDDSNNDFSNQLTETFSKLFDLLNFMRRDFCNFRLKSMVARIEGKGIAEQYELDELKNRFPSELIATKLWLNLNSSSRAKMTPLEVLVSAYMRFFNPEQNEILELEVPETFYLDVGRLVKYRLELKNSMIRDAAFIYVKNYLLQKMSKSEKLDTELEELRKTATLMIDIKDVRSLILNYIERYKAESIEILKGNIERLFEKPSEDKVMILLKNREFSKLKSNLMSGYRHQSDDVRGKICNLFQYNKACFNSIYDSIILNFNSI